MFNSFKPRILNVIVLRHFSHTRAFKPVAQLKGLHFVSLRTSLPLPHHSLIACRSLSLISSHFAIDKGLELPEDEVLKPLESGEVLSDSSLELLPDLDSLQTSASDAAAALSAGAGHTLESLGLGGYWPVGLVQQLLDLIHSSTGLPWFGTIALCTLAARILMFPLIIEGQKRSINMSNHMPELQKLQIKLFAARHLGDKAAVEATALEMSNFVKKHGLSPLSALKPMLLQAPVFCSFFFALRGMAAAPLESLKTGGALWFTDLTVSDPYFVLPIVTCTTLFICLEIGADGIKASQMMAMKYTMRAMPLIMLPVIINFPTAILCYWGTNNLISLVQTLLLRQPAVREYFNIPKYNPSSQQSIRSLFDKASFSKAVQESINNLHIAAQVEERQQVEKEIEKRAGGTPPQLPSSPTLDSKRPLSMSTKDETP